MNNELKILLLIFLAIIFIVNPKNIFLTNHILFKIIMILLILYTCNYDTRLTILLVLIFLTSNLNIEKFGTTQNGSECKQNNDCASLYCDIKTGEDKGICKIMAQDEINTGFELAKEKKRENGKKCDNNNQCHSGYCKKKSGEKKGKCRINLNPFKKIESRKNGKECDHNNQCASSFCDKKAGSKNGRSKGKCKNKIKI